MKILKNGLKNLFKKNTDLAFSLLSDQSCENCLNLTIFNQCLVSKKGKLAKNHFCDKWEEISIERPKRLKIKVVRG